MPTCTEVRSGYCLLRFDERRPKTEQEGPAGRPTLGIRAKSKSSARGARFADGPPSETGDGIGFDLHDDAEDVAVVVPLAVTGSARRRATGDGRHVGSPRWSRQRPTEADALQPDLAIGQLSASEAS